MDQQTAQIVIIAGAAVGFVVWLMAMHLYRKMADAPAVEVVEASVAGTAPAAALKSIAENAARFPGLVRLSRPAEGVLEIDQAGCHARINAKRSGNQTQLYAEIDAAALGRKLQRVMALFVVLIMPAAIVGVSAGLWHYAAPSPAAAVRWQCVQVLQMSHALWPAFLVYAVWNRTRTAMRDAISNLMVLAEAA